MRLTERLRRLESLPVTSDHVPADLLSDEALERVVAESLGWTPERVHNMTDAELATVAEGGTP